MLVFDDESKIVTIEPVQSGLFQISIIFVDPSDSSKITKSIKINIPYVKKVEQEKEEIKEKIKIERVENQLNYTYYDISSSMNYHSQLIIKFNRNMIDEHDGFNTSFNLSEVFRYEVVKS